MPEVTVVIPNYNYARFLEKRVQSVLNQTFPDFEILYLDDASTDDSNRVMAKFAGDSRIRCIHNQVNSGNPFRQWNKGVHEARGKYVWIAEADDFADERFLSVLVERLDNNPQVGIAYCQSLVVDAEDHVLANNERWTAMLDPERWRRDFINNGKDECGRFLILRNTIPNASAVLFRRSVYEQAGYADETLRQCGDWMTWVNMLQISDVAFVAEPMNYYRLHSASVTHRNSFNEVYAREAWRVIRFILENDPIPRDPRTRLRIARAIIMCFARRIGVVRATMRRIKRRG